MAEAGSSKPKAATAAASQDDSLALPVARVSKIIKTHEDCTGTVGKDSTVAIARAAEMFLVALAEKAGDNMGSRKVLNYDAVAAAVHGWPACDWLEEVVPKRVQGKTLLAMQKQQQQQQKDPQQQQKGGDSKQKGADSKAGTEMASPVKATPKPAVA